MAGLLRCLQTSVSRLRLRNQLCYFGACAHWLDEKNVLRIQVHPVRRVQFFPSLDQHVVDLLALGICLRHDVIDARQLGARSAEALQMTEIYGTISEQDRLVGRGELYGRVAQVSRNMPSGSNNL